MVERAGCGKTYFTQKLAVSRFYGELNGHQILSWPGREKLKTSLVLHTM